MSVHGVRLRCALCLACLGTLLLARPATAGASLAAEAITAVLDAAACAELNNTLNGAVFTSQNPSYDVASKTWNHLQQGPAPVMPHSVPAVYVVATGIPDVLTALEFAIQHRLKTSFLANGHQFGDASLLSDGMTIDVNDLNDATADPETMTGFFQPGVNGGRFGNVTGAYGLYFPVTHVSSVGLAGYTLGYGNGWGTNLIGAAVDNLIALDVVNTWDYSTTGTLEVVTVNATSYPDLFWGLRGAGQNLAAVVGFHVQLHHLPPNNMVPLLETAFPLTLAAQAYTQWLEWKQTAPSTLEATIGLASIGYTLDLVTFFLYNWDPTGTDEASTAAIQNWATRAKTAGALAALPTTMSWADILTSQDATQDYPNIALYNYSPFVQLGAITVDVFSALATHYSNTSRGPNSIIIISDATENVGVSNSDTAFGFRNTSYVWIWSLWTRSSSGAAADGDAAHIAWVEAGKQILQPLAIGQYINMCQWTSPNDTQFSYTSQNWPRVVQLKAKYDARNVFRDLAYWRPREANSIDWSPQDVDGAVAP